MLKPPKKTVYRGHLLTPVSGSVRKWADWPDGRLEVDDGRITSAGPWKRTSSSYVDLRPHILFPGFVDTHAHIPQLAVCGVHPENLLSWLQKWIFPLEQRFRGERARTLSRRFLGEMLSNGTTTAALYTSAWPDSVSACFSEADRLGIHAWIGNPLMDVQPYRRTSTRALLHELETLRKLDRPRLRYTVTPRFALSCTPELLEGAADLARRHELPIQTHLAEQEPECREVRRRFGRGYVDVYERAGLLGSRTLLAHAVWMSPRDWKRISACAVAHCPTSNIFLGSGVMDWSAAARSRVGLGSDVGAGPDLSIPRVVRTAWMAQSLRGSLVSPPDLLRAATLGGAEALGFTDVGSLEPGRCADFLVLNSETIIPPGAPALESTDDLLSRIAHRSGRSSIRDVHVSGVRVAGRSLR